MGPFDGRLCQRETCSLHFGSRSPWPYIWCFVRGCINKFWACYFSCAQWGRKKCHSTVIPNWVLFNRSDVISRFSIHSRFPSLNICLTYSPMGTGCFRKALRGQPSRSLSQHLRGLLAAALALLSAVLAAATTHTSYFPARSPGSGGVNQSKLDVGQTEQIIQFPLRLKTGGLKQHEEYAERGVSKKERRTSATAFQPPLRDTYTLWAGGRGHSQKRAIWPIPSSKDDKLY